MDALAIESWTWYALTWMVVMVRMISRRMLHGSFKKMQIDDFLIICAMVTDTILMVGMNIISHTNSNLINPDDQVELSAASIQERIFGSKMVLVVEQMQILTTWTVKCCLLVMYGRLTLSLKQNLIVKIVAGYVVFGFIFMEIFYFAVWCRPFQEYWAVPTNNVQCSAATNHLITNAVLNISSDFMIIAIPMPIFLHAQLPTKRKVILCGVFALGTFTILSATLNKYYSFHEPFGSSWTFWYIRESSTAIITANLPLTWTFLRRVFNLRAFQDKLSKQRTGDRTQPSRSGYMSHHSQPVGDHEDLTPWADSSQEQINRSQSISLQIYERKEIHVTTETASDSSQASRPSVAGEGFEAPQARRTVPSSKFNMGVVTTCGGVQPRNARNL